MHRCPIGLVSTFCRPFLQHFVSFHDVSSYVSTTFCRPFPRHCVVRFRGVSSSVCAAFRRPLRGVSSSVFAEFHLPFPRRFVVRFRGVLSSVSAAFRRPFPRRFIVHFSGVSSSISMVGCHPLPRCFVTAAASRWISVIVLDSCICSITNSRKKIPTRISQKFVE